MNIQTITPTQATACAPVNTRPPEVSTMKFFPEVVKPKPETKGSNALKRKTVVRKEKSIVKEAGLADC